MAVSLKHKDTDISNYLDDAALVPFISRNRDYSLRSETWDIKIPMTYTTALAIDDKMEVYDGTKLIFAGEISKIVPDESADVYNVSIESSIRLLRSKKLEFTNLYHHFDGTNWYDFTVNGSCYYNWPVIGLIHFLKCAFTVCGLTLTTTNAEDVSYLPLISATSQGDFNGGSASNYTKPKYMFFRGDLLFAVNQNVVAGYPTLDSMDYDYNQNKVNYFDVISQICSRLFFVLELTAYKTYDLRISAEYPAGDLLNILTTADNDILSINEELTRGADLGEVGITYTDAYTLASSWYYETTSAEVPEKAVGVGRSTSFMRNLEILISDAYDNANKYGDLFAFTRLGIVLANDGDAQSTVTVVKDLSTGTPQTYDETAWALPNQGLSAYKSLAVAVTNKKIVQPMTTDFYAEAENFIDINNKNLTSQTLEIY